MASTSSAAQRIITIVGHTTPKTLRGVARRLIQARG
jgi:hypothetical protein